MAGGHRRRQTIAKTARWSLRLGRGFDRDQGALSFAPRHMDELLGADLLQHVAHAGTGSLVMATSFARTALALPESIAVSASALPAFRSPALPASINVAAALNNTTS